MNEFPTTNSIVKSIIKNEPPQAPYRATIDLTNCCNLRCEFCWFHSPENPKKEQPEHVNTSTIVAVIHELADMGTKVIYLSGAGDPSSHPDFPEIVKNIKNKGLHLTINTNMAIASNRSLEAYALSDHLMVNLAASDVSTYNIMHSPKKKAAFSSVCQNIRSLIKPAQAKRPPFIEISYVVTKNNFRNIPQTISAMRDLGVPSIWFKTLQPTPFSASLMLGSKDWQELLKIISNISKQPLGIHTNLLDMLRSRRNSYPKNAIPKNCFIGWYNIKLRQNGDVGLCCLNHKLIIGNYNQNKIRSIWHGPTAQHLRLQVQNHINSRKLTAVECRFCPYTKINNQIITALQQHGYSL